METRNAVDGIIKYKNGIVLIERKNDPIGLALPGGKVEWNETLEEAIKREIFEETNLNVSNLKQFKTYSEPLRDPRHRTISTVFTADGYGTLQAKSDARNALIMPSKEINNLSDQLVFDHFEILNDYLNTNKTNSVQHKETSGNFIVLYKRDRRTEAGHEGFKKYESNRMLFDKMTKFNDVSKAKEFIEEKFHESAILAKLFPLSPYDILNGDSKFLAIGTYDGKYNHYSYDGSSDSLITYDAIKCSQEDELKRAIEKMQNEANITSIKRALELDIF